MDYDYLIAIASGLENTLFIAIGSLLLALILGISYVLMRFSTKGWMNWIANTYSIVIRGIPDLVLMLLLFYGGQSVLNLLLEALHCDRHIEISAQVAGILIGGIIFGAYIGETFRGALLAIPLEQSEAGYAYGLTNQQVFFRIRLPQMIRFALPGLTNNWLILLKNTALISLIGLQDIMYQAKRAGEATAKPFTYLLIAAGIYLFLTTVSILIIYALERRYSPGLKMPS